MPRWVPTDHRERKCAHRQTVICMANRHSQAIVVLLQHRWPRSLLLLLDWIGRKIENTQPEKQRIHSCLTHESNDYDDNNLRFYFIVQTRHDLCVRNDFKDFHSLAAPDVFILLAIFRFFFSVFSPSGDACCTHTHTLSDSKRKNKIKTDRNYARDREMDNMEFFPCFGTPLWSHTSYTWAHI